MKEIRLKTSLVVIGAGPAGICAALEAARLGVDTILAHNRPVLGGNSSSEVRVWMRGATGGGNLFSEEMGVLGGLKMKNLYANPEFNPVFWDEILLDAVLGESRITLLLNTNIEEIEKNQGKIKWVKGVQQSSEHIYILEADYFIDATGDGIIGDLAGVPYQIGESRYESKKKDVQYRLLSSSILYYVKNAGKPIKFVPPDYAYDIPYIESLVNKGGRIISEKQTGSDCWWFEFGGLQNTISDAQEIGLELKKLVMGVWDYIKNSGRYPDAENYTLEWIGNIPGKRESRRMITDYILKQDDIVEQRSFHDTAFYGGWYMDFHPAEGLESGEENCVQIPVQIYEIPFRCLYYSGVPNLIFAGRIIGTEQGAYASTRIMDTCALSGQAAAALVCQCLTVEKTPSKLTEKHIGELQNMLMREDMFLPGYRYEDPDDLAKSAGVSASSQAQVWVNPSETYLKTENDFFFTVPGQNGRKIKILLHAGKETEVSICFYHSGLPNREKPGRLVKEEKRKIPEGNNWMEMILPENSADNFTTICIHGAGNVAPILNRRWNPGFLCGKSGSSRYESPCIDVEDPKVYSVENVLDGYTRPFEKIHLWRSEMEEYPWICLEWKEEIQFQEIRLFLNPNLSEEIPSSCAERWDESHRFTMRRGMPPQLMRDFKISIFREGRWEDIRYIRDNWNRLAIIQFREPVSARKLKITACDIWGREGAQIYQICVYNNRIQKEG